MTSMTSMWASASKCKTRECGPQRWWHSTSFTCKAAIWLFLLIVVIVFWLQYLNMVHERKETPELSTSMLLLIFKSSEASLCQVTAVKLYLWVSVIPLRATWRSWLCLTRERSNCDSFDTFELRLADKTQSVCVGGGQAAAESWHHTLLGK